MGEKINPLGSRRPLDFSRKSKEQIAVTKTETSSSEVKPKVESKPVVKEYDKTPYSKRIYTGAIRTNFKKDFQIAKKKAYDISFEMGESVNDGDLLMFYMALGNKFKLANLFKKINPDDGSIPTTKEELIEYLQKLK